jgi:hypothetical protein
MSLDQCFGGQYTNLLKIAIEQIDENFVNYMYQKIGKDMWPIFLNKNFLTRTHVSNQIVKGISMTMIAGKAHDEIGCTNLSTKRSSASRAMLLTLPYV